MLKLILPFCLILWFSCSTKKAAISQKDSPEEAIFTDIKTQAYGPVNSVYQFKEGGEGEEPEESKLAIIPIDSNTRYLHREVYNVYEDESGNVEIYVSQFEIDLLDSVNRQKLKDYELVSQKDTTFLTPGDTYEFTVEEALDFEINGQIIQVFMLAGYAHEGDAEPGHYKFWNPAFGVILIWYGGNRTFELIATGKPEDKELIDQLKAKILEHILMEK